MEAQSVIAVAQGMESRDGVLGVVGVDVEKSPLSAYRDVGVVSQGPDRGAEFFGHRVVERSLVLADRVFLHAAMPERSG